MARGAWEGAFREMIVELRSSGRLESLPYFGSIT